MRDSTFCSCICIANYLKAKKKKRKETIILIRSFVDLCSSSHQHCGSSSFNSRLPLNITSREAPRTIIFVREHANVSTITTVHSRVLHRLQRCTRLSRRPWSLESENYVQNVLRPFSSILFPSFLLFYFFFFFFFFLFFSFPCLHHDSATPFGSQESSRSVNNIQPRGWKSN